MKIVIEFNSKAEHDQYIKSHKTGRHTFADEDVSVPTFKGQPVADYTRRKSWSQLELAFLKDNYQAKKITWIAKQLRRKPTQVYQRLHEMYKNGLPAKRPSNGAITTKDF